MQRAKTATKAQKTIAKGPFGLLLCHYRSIAVITKSATIDRPFSGALGLLRRTENRCHMRLPFGSSDLLAVGIKRRYRAY